MAKVTLQRATQLTGKARSTIHRAMKQGRVSYETDEHGTRHIDVAELERAFGLLPQQPEGNGAQAFDRYDLERQELRQQLEVASVKVAMLETRTTDLVNERDRLLRILEHQSEQLKQLTHEHTAEKPGWRRWLFWRRGQGG
jgi:hypothetical protein